MSKLQPWLFSNDMLILREIGSLDCCIIHTSWEKRAAIIFTKHVSVEKVASMNFAFSTDLVRKRQLQLSLHSLASSDNGSHGTCRVLRNVHEKSHPQLLPDAVASL